MFFGGTGSLPEVPHGWHFDILLIVKNKPVHAPQTLNASIEYAEQLGSCLQFDPRKGLIAIWYALTKAIKICCMPQRY